MERRAYPRVVVIHPVLYSTVIYPRPKIASTLDLSLGGAKIDCRHKLDRDEKLEISIAIEPVVIKCKGRVAHVAERKDGKVEAGIEFEELSANDKLYLKQYLFHVMEQRALEASLSVE
jgi:c-di-GMP-binding flagellar brake protein YcgR